MADTTIFRNLKANNSMHFKALYANYIGKNGYDKAFTIKKSFGYSRTSIRWYFFLLCSFAILLANDIVLCFISTSATYTFITFLMVLHVLLFFLVFIIYKHPSSYRILYITDRGNIVTDDDLNIIQMWSPQDNFGRHAYITLPFSESYENISFMPNEWTYGRSLGIFPTSDKSFDAIYKRLPRIYSKTHVEEEEDEEDDVTEDYSFVVRGKFQPDENV
jgi:hypothetical protein